MGSWLAMRLEPKRSPHSPLLLVEVKTGTATLDNYLTATNKAYCMLNKAIQCLCIYLREYECICPPEHMYKNGHSIFNNSKKQKTTKCSSTLGHTNWYLVLSNHKERNVEITQSHG